MRIAQTPTPEAMPSAFAQTVHEPTSAAQTDAAPGLRRSENGALIVVATLLSTAALWFAQAILVPIVMGILISYALDPIQRRIVKWGIPRALAAALLLCVVVAGCGGTAYVLRNQAAAFVAEIPRLAQQLKTTVMTYRRSSPGAVEQIQKAANDLNEVATAPLTPAPGLASPLVAPVPPARRPVPFYRKEWFWGAVAVVVVTGIVVTVLALGSGDPATPSTKLGDMNAF